MVLAGSRRGRAGVHVRSATGHARRRSLAGIQIFALDATADRVAARDGIFVGGRLRTPGATVFAGRFYPYLEPAIATPPSTPLIAFLQSQPKPFRIAPFFITLWPNTSELYQLEDVRSHFSSEAKYRRLLSRIDPTSFTNNSTVIGFNSLKFDFADPLASLLGVRYYVEKRDIDIIKWTTFRNTVLAGKPTTILPGTLLQQSIRIDGGPFYAIELPISMEQEIGPNPRIVVTLRRGNTVLYGRAFTPSDTPVPALSARSESVLSITSSGGVRPPHVLCARPPRSSSASISR